MLTLLGLGTRYRESFARYSAADGRLRRLRAALTASPESAEIHGINAEFGNLMTAEREYQAARLEYVDRLLRPEAASVTA